MRRLSLGIVLITLASSVLLFSDWNQRRAAPGKLPRVAIFQYATNKAFDDAVDGLVEALAEAGFVDGQTIAYKRFNAENDAATAAAISKEIVNSGFDLILTVSTLSMQSLANANREGRTPHVFGLVIDPAGAGAGVSRDDPMGHPPHLTGIASVLPVKEGFRLARQMYPGLKTVGVAWNASETNSAATTRLAREVSAELGISLLEVNVENSSAAQEAVNSLISRGAQAIWVGADTTVVVALDSVVAAARRARIPVFTSVPDSRRIGTLFELGSNYFEMGRLEGGLAAKVLKGASTAALPIVDVLPEHLAVNKVALEGLRDPWRIPREVIARADVVFDQDGAHQKAAAAKAPPPLGKKWKVYLVEFNNVLDVEESEAGILEGLREGLVEGRDFEFEIGNAQGDMATLTGVVEAALAGGANMLITMSTPTLQVALQRARGTPVVFTYVASAIAAGAGRTREDHAPNVTGVEMIGAYDEIFELIREILPSARRVGTLFSPAEVNMVVNKEMLVKEAAKAGFEVVPIAVNTSSEVSDAALAMVSRDIDAVCQIGGNLTAASFGGIAQAARKANLAVFAFQKQQALGGAAVTLARDYHDAGIAAAAMAVRIMRGESPARIPIQSFNKTKLMINPAAIRAVGLKIPESIMKRNPEMIGN